MSDSMTTAGGIPVGIPPSTFVPERRTKDAFVCFPETGFPWNWTARAYVLRDGLLIGPLWSGFDPGDPHATRLVSGRGEEKVLHELLPSAESHPFTPGEETEFLERLMEGELRSMIVVEPALEPGQYHPRIWRSGFLHSERKISTYPPLSPTRHFQSFVASVHRFENLCRALNDLFLAVYPGEANADAYGFESRNLLLLACTEVECQWRSVLQANHYPGTRFTTNDYVKLLGVMRLDGYRLMLRRYPGFPAVCPFGRWDKNLPTGSLDWYDAYNHVKHDAENSLPRAKFRYAVTAVAAVFALLVAQFGLGHVRDYLDDRTFVLDDFPRWTPEHWYYEPPPRQPWVEVDYQFH